MPSLAIAANFSGNRAHFWGYYMIGYRFRFNGKENDKETYGDGNALDFGARILNTKLGKWFAVDPLTAKFASESPYNYVGNNPLVFSDPDGEEKIIVIGGGDNSGKDRNKFLNSGLKQMNTYVDLLTKSKSNEPVTLVVYDKFLDKQMKDQLAAIVNNKDAAYKGQVNIVYISTGDELTNYLNSKSTKNEKISDARRNDLITDAAFFGHGYSPKYASQGSGYAGSFEPGHGEPNESMLDPISKRPVHNQLAWGLNDVSKLDKAAWSQSATCNFESCNSATNGRNNTSLAQILSYKLQITTTGWQGLSDYSTIYEKGGGGNPVKPAANLPSAGTSISGVKGGAIKITYKKGVKQ